MSAGANVVDLAEIKRRKIIAQYVAFYGQAKVGGN